MSYMHGAGTYSGGGMGASPLGIWNKEKGEKMGEMGKKKS